MRLLVTGARGFVGRAIGSEAIRLGWQVLGIGRASQAPDGWLGSYHWADIAQSDLSGVLRDFRPDYVFHGAGAASVSNSISHPFDDFRASVLTFASLLDAVRRSDTDPVVIFPSSAAVYGNPKTLPVAEEAPINPISPYGYHKYQCELLAREYSTAYGLRVLITRVFSLFGANQRRLLVWELYQQLASDSSNVQLLGTGEESRDYLSVDDAASLMLNLAMMPRDYAGLPCFNIASGKETSVLSLLDKLSKILGVEKQVQASQSTRQGDPTKWIADMSKVISELPQWSPPTLDSQMNRVVATWNASSNRY